MRLRRAELVRVAMPLVRPFRTSFGEQRTRDVLLVHVETDLGEGWGECAAHAEPFYNEEFTGAAAEVAARWLLPAVARLDDLTGERVAAACSQVKGYRAAKAGIEMAVLDAELRSTGVALARHLGAERTAVDVGVSIGIPPSVDELVAQVAGYLDDGYRRVKLKIMPGFDVEPVGAVRRAFPDLVLQVDANAGYTGDHVEHLRSLDRFGLLMIEQPFAPEELRRHADLAATMHTPICLDESILSVAHTTTALDLGACSIVNIKVGRVGGVLEAARIHDTCCDRGVPVWCGGMLETGIGRAANLAVAALPGFAYPADISASDRYWRRDLTAPFELRGSTIAVPDSPGLGIDVDLDALDEFGAVRTEVALDGRVAP